MNKVYKVSEEALNEFLNRLRNGFGQRGAFEAAIEIEISAGNLVLPVISAPEDFRTVQEPAVLPKPVVQDTFNRPKFGKDKK